MKVELIDEETIYLYLCDDINILDSDKEQITHYIKQKLLLLKNIYGITLSGFYEVIVYPNIVSNVIKIINIDSYNSKSIDLRIIVSDEENIYARFKYFEILSDYTSILMDKEYFYLDTNKLKKEDIVKLSDFYDIILESELDFPKLKEIKIK